MHSTSLTRIDEVLAYLNEHGEKEYRMMYYGSASYNNKQNDTHVEGTEKMISYKGDMKKHIYDIECSLRSAVSYAGVKNIQDMHGTPMFIM